MNYSDALDEWVDERIRLYLKDHTNETTEPVAIVDSSLCIPHFNGLANLKAGLLNDNSVMDYHLAMLRGSVVCLVDRETLGYRMYIVMPKNDMEDIAINENISLVELDRLWLEED